MGSENDFREMLNFIEQKKIKPLTDKIFEFGDYISAFERMNRSEQIGKIVIKI
jgi:zinc-binding alcohol dehydrogenase/oxidoreductase